MSSIDERVFCDFSKCPIHEKCNNYRIYINKQKRLHWGVYPYPYKNKNGECIGFESKELDSTENSNGE
jgi:hypothetical protein